MDEQIGGFDFDNLEHVDYEAWRTGTERRFSTAFTKFADGDRNEVVFWFDGPAAGKWLSQRVAEPLKQSGHSLYLRAITESENAVVPRKFDDGGFCDFEWWLETKRYHGVLSRAAASGDLLHVLAALVPQVKDTIAAIRIIHPEADKTERTHNSGNVFKTNPPPLEYDELRFRTPYEINMYRAFLELGIPLMPLPVVVLPGSTRTNGASRRCEPDFMFVHRGRLIVLEIDGPSHTESPAAAERRLRILQERGVIVRRVENDETLTEKAARDTLSRIVASLDREMDARP